MEITSQRSGTERALEKVDVVVVQQEFEMLLHLQQADQRGRLLPQLQQELGCRGVTEQVCVHHIRETAIPSISLNRILSGEGGALAVTACRIPR
jgi:hypothetical protein